MHNVVNNITLKDDYNGKKVFIGVGHGGTDPGAMSNGLIEKNINLIMALACKSELERHGVSVALSRSLDEIDTVNQEVAECNAYKPDIAIDCHNNSGGGNGFEAFYWPGSYEGFRLAQMLEAEVKAIGQNSRGLKTGEHLKFVNGTKCTAVLVEGFFLDNSKDKTVADTIVEQQAFGKAYAKGILKYFGIAYKENTTHYKVQVGSFENRTHANSLVNELKSKGYDAYVTT